MHMSFFYRKSCAMIRHGNQTGPTTTTHVQVHVPPMRRIGIATARAAPAGKKTPVLFSELVGVGAIAGDSSDQLTTAPRAVGARPALPDKQPRTTHAGGVTATPLPPPALPVPHMATCAVRPLRALAS